MSSNTAIKTVEFPIRIGDRRMTFLSLPMTVVHGDFLDAPPDIEGSLPRLAGQRGAAGVLFRSAPGVDGARLRLDRGWLRYVPSRYRRHYIPIVGTFDEYQQHFSGKTRSGLRRKVRKLREHFRGRLELRVCADVDTLLGFHGMAREVSAATYQERLFDEGLPLDEDFRRGMLEAAGRQQAIGFLLLGDDRPIAYIYCPVEGRRIVYRYVGYDSAHARLSPGTVLQWLALEYLFEHRSGQVFDFTEGEGEHKAFFGTRSVECADVYYLRPGLRGWAVCLAHDLSERLNTVSGRLLDRMGLKRAVKRLLRR